MGYEWDPAKAISNQKKHGVDFADAVGVLEDPLALTIEHQDFDGENRFVTIGADCFNRILVVVYTYRKGNIRLISVRSATRKERQSYE
jgi:uncharacterized protein